ncbi:MAG: hypothetical protein ISR44_03860, partial [Rhodospirillales bacterium]|nr:hypothetical protein [Rhodospirillales bacterium]
ATRRDKGRAEVVDLFRQLRKASPDSSARLHEGLQSLLETTLHRALYAQAAQEDEDDENPDQPEKPENPNPTPPPEEPKEPEQPKPNPDDPKKPKPEKPDDDKREKCAALAAALRRATIWHQTFADDYAETAKEIPVLREETKAAKLDYDKLLAAFLASLTPGGAAANALRRLGVIGQNAARAIGRASDLATNVPTGLPSEVAAAYEEWQKKKSKLEDAIIHRDYCLEQKNKYSAEMDRIGDEMSENGC